jgi:CelD/BcsL family acetyltransferase involved in cellulose biosynthesis
MARPTDRWHFEWCRTWRDVWSDPFERTWRTQLEASGATHVYHQPALVKAWADTCAHSSQIEPLFGRVRSATGVELLLPWVVVRRAGRLTVRRTLEAAGGDLFGYQSPLLAGADPADVDWLGFWTAVRGQIGSACDQALFRSVPAEFVRGITSEPAEESPVLRIRAFHDFESLLARCSANHRGEIRRRRRRLAERGPVSLWIAGAGDSAGALADWQSRAMPAYKAVWGRRRQPNSLLRPGIDGFLSRVIDAGLREGWSHYAVLSVGECPVAWHLGLLDRGRLYWWIPAHEPDWEPYAPGKVLLAALLEHGFEAGWREVHFLAGAHAYKLAWHPEPSDLRAVRWHAPGLKGTVLSWYDSMRRSA